MSRSLPLLVAVAVSAIFILLLASSKVFILRGFEKVEEQQGLGNVGRVLEIVHNELAAMERTATDWSVWDEPYAFVDGKNPDFVQRNLTPDTYDYLKTDIIVITTSDGRIIFGRQFDRKSKTLTPLPASLPRQILSCLRFLPATEYQKSLTGVLLLPEGPYLISARRIIDSKGNGPSRGLLLMGRRIGTTETAEFSRISHSTVSIKPVTEVPTTLTSKLAQLPPDVSPALFRTVDGFRSEGYGLIRDIFGKPALMVELQLQRTVYTTGKKAVLYFIVWIMGTILLAAFSGVFLYHKLAQSQRERNEHDGLYRSVVSQSIEGILLVDKESGILLKANPGIHRMLGYDDGVLVGSLLSTIADEDPLTLANWLLAAASENRSGKTEFLLRHRDGTTLHTEVGTCEVQFQGKKSICLSFHNITDRIVAAEVLRKVNEELEIRVDTRTAELSAANEELQRDIEERQRVETALRKEESIRRNMFEAIPDMLTVIDRDFRIIHSNWGGGYDYVPLEQRKANCHCYDAFYPGQGKICEPCHVHKVFATGKPVYQEKHNPRIGQVEVRAYPIFDESGQVVMAIEHIRDITERKKLEEERIKSQKLQSLGVLAGGIAHDFNNILTGVLGNISLARTLTEPNSKLARRLEEAEKATQRAGDLTQQLLTFSRGGEPVKKSANIKQLAIDSVSFVLRGSNVRCDFSLPDDLWPVEVDAGQMNQVFNNLIINADQAMPEGGIIRVLAENMLIGQEKQPILPEGRYVKISVRDQGSGIPEANLGKIFDPYFTTKAKGNGLGLATVYSIINKHGGLITVESQVGVGTAFHFFLPAAELDPDDKEHENRPPASGKGKILIMDDEEIIQEVAGEILRHLGYKVEFCNEGSEAIAKYKLAAKTGEPYDAVLLDLTIPGGMGGKETMKLLLEIDPEAKGIVSSGYSSDPILSHYGEFGFCGVVLKPYAIGEISKTMHEVLSGARHDQCGVTLNVQSRSPVVKKR